MFSGRAAFDAAPERDGFVVESGGGALVGRFGGEVFRVERVGARVRYAGQGFDLALDPADVAGSVSGAAAGPVDLSRLRIMLPILDALAAPGAVTYVGAAR